MNTFQSGIYFNQDALSDLGRKLNAFINNRKKIFLLADSNTKLFCWPVFQSWFPDIAAHFILIEIPSGEENKDFAQLRKIWQALTNDGAGKDAILINLGGGVVTDIGGFAAATYKRGIKTIHIPTTLLGMVDAALGGKTAIDFEGIKNHIGAFYQPDSVYVFTEFLKTLPQKQWQSGLGELFKYSFINGKGVDQLKILMPDQQQLSVNIIREAAMFKLEIVAKDPDEKGFRKILNFGHTIGHAFESFAMLQGSSLTHGEAIAAGIVAELYLSVKVLGLKQNVLIAYIDIYKEYFDPFSIHSSNIDKLVHLIAHDKKNRGSEVLMVGIDSERQAVFDVKIEPEQLSECLAWYSKLF